MLLFGRELKAKVGEDRILTHCLTRPPSAAPTVSVKLDSGTVNVGAMSPMWTAGTASSVEDGDRSVLNLAGSVSDARGLAADYGDAWLVSDETAPVKVRVLRFVGGASPKAYLAEPLPYDHSGAGTLEPAWYSVTLTAAAVTGTAQRHATLQVSWTEDSGTDSPAHLHSPPMALHIVEQPFETGVTERDLLAVDPHVAAMDAGHDPGFRKAISAALDEVVLRLREDLRDAGMWEDDVLFGHRSPLVLCHTYLALALVLDRADPEQAARYRERVWGSVDSPRAGLWKPALERIVLDADADGVADDGEVEQVTGPRYRAAGPFTTAAADDLTFTRNSRTTF